MKKPIIKNWIKYWSTTIAVSGMLAMGACDNSSNTAENTADNIETTTEDAVTSTRENVNQGMEDMENEAEQLTATETTEEQEADTESAVNQPQYEQTSNRPASSDRSASSIRNMDAHLEEYEAENEAIKEELTDANLSDQNNNSAEMQGNPNASMNQQGATGYQQSGAEQDSDPTQADTRVKSDMEGNQTNTIVSDNPGGNNYGNRTQDNNRELFGTGQNHGQSYFEDNAGENQQGTTTGTMDNQQGTTTGNQNLQGQDQAVEYETNRQGTTEMNIQNNNQGTQQDNLDTTESGTENESYQGTQPGTVNDSQGETYNNAGNTTDQESSSDMYTPEDSQLNQNNPQGGEINQQNNNGVEQRTFDQQNDQGINQQGTSGMEQQGNNDLSQSNTQMNQNTGAENPALIYERHIMTYGEDMSDENRQRMEDIGREYSERRENMRGQMDPETGAYVSPEVDPQPQVGYNQLLEQIQENINYSQDAVAAEMEGTVYVNFVVDEKGNITKAQAYEDVIVPAANLESATTPLNPNNFNENEIEELRKEMRKEAVRAVEQTSGQWEAGMQDGQPVKSEVQIPVQFEIADAGTGQ